MKKVVLSLLFVSLTALLSAEIPYQLVKVFPDVAIFYILFISSLVSIALAVFMYAKTFEDHVTICPSVHFHPVNSLDEAIEEMKRKSPPTDSPSEDPSPTPSPVTRKGMIKKGEKLSPEHKAKISESLKKRAAEKKANEKKKSGK